MPKSLMLHNLARLRIGYNLTQAELAKAIGYSRHTIKSVELGKLPISRKLACKIAEYLNVSEEFLLSSNLELPIPPKSTEFQIEDTEWL